MRYVYGLIAALVLLTATPAMAQQQRTGSQCLDTTALFYNCLKGSELQKNLGTTYLLGAIQALTAMEMITLPTNKTMVNYRFEYLDFVETHPSVHNEKPGRGVTMYLLKLYRNKENEAGMQLAKKLGLLK